MEAHEFKEGDIVRVTNVESHLYGEANFEEGDMTVILASGFLLGFIPGVLVMPTKEDAPEEAIMGGVPFAGEDLLMLTKVESE